MTTPMRGPSLDPATNQIYPKYIPAGYGGSVDSAGVLAEAQANAVDAITNYIATPDNAARGARFDVDCRAGQPLRASLFTGTERTDVYFNYWMLTDPSQATGYAIDGDGHVRAIGPGA